MVHISAMSNQPVTLDQFIPLGGYVIYICLIWEFILLVQLGNMLYMICAAATPTILGCGNVTFSGNLSNNDICIFLRSMNATCEPVVAEQFKSINAEFGYLCDDARYVKHSISIELAGAMIGALTFGQISDRFGRRMTLLFALSGLSLFGALSSFSGGLIEFVIIRFVTGIFNGASMSVLNVFTFENLPQRYRLWLNTLLTWSPNFVLFALLAYYSEDWRTLARATSGITLPAIVLLFFAYETPSWLIQHGHLKAAEDAIVTMNKWARKDVRDHLDIVELRKAIGVICFQSNGCAEKAKNYYFYHLFTSSKLLKYVVTLSFSLVVTSIVHYGLLFNMEKLSGSLYWNLVYTGIIRYTFNIVAGALDRTFSCVGRRFIHLGSHVFVSGTIGAVVFINLFDGSHSMDTVIRILVLCGVSMTSQLYIVNVLCAAELFPTAIRNVADSQLAIWNRTGTVIAPQIFFLDSIWEGLPYAFMMFMCLIDSVLFHCFIPETKDQPLVDSMPEADLFRRKPKVEADPA
ncbi:Organic cation transporter-like protein [Toxocara canis]|uniref:Organic cation transporter-like protein n=1 Tax=Toxocara canis TaxID=6265 RepID=A0A0B2UY75_TOXCA|nr:Organic cation transporter-like protein [Toxocara canis]